MAEREKLAPRINASQRSKMDLEKLWLQPEFKRFLFYLLKRAGMYDLAYGTDGRHLPFVEGRRSLGFDILCTFGKSPDEAHALILAEAVKSQLEAPHARRPYERLSELDDDGKPDRPGDGIFLDYPADGE